MKTKHFLFTGMLAFAFAGMIITGCKKESTADTDATAAQDDANATYAVNDSKNISDGAAKGQATERPWKTKTCGVARRFVDTNITIGGITYTQDTGFVITFPGTCVSPDGRIRKGQILVCWTGKGYFDSAAVISQTWINYSFTTLSGTTIGVAGYRTITNTGRNDSGDHNWSFNANLTLSYSTGGTATWTAQHTCTLTPVTVGGSKIWFYVITGSASGMSKSGNSYTLNITQPLYWTAYWLNIINGNTPCYCFEAGQVEFSRTGKTYPLYLTFTSGVGSCNYTATATINGNSYAIICP